MFLVFVGLASLAPVPVSTISIATKTNGTAAASHHARRLVLQRHALAVADQIGVESVHSRPFGEESYETAPHVHETPWSAISFAAGHFLRRFEAATSGRAGTTWSSAIGAFLSESQGPPLKQPGMPTPPPGPPAVPTPKVQYEERPFLGIPKMAWALLAAVFAMICYVLCIPAILQMAKKKPPRTLSHVTNTAW